MHDLTPWRWAQAATVGCKATAVFLTWALVLGLSGCGSSPSGVNLAGEVWRSLAAADRAIPARASLSPQFRYLWTQLNDSAPALLVLAYEDQTANGLLETWYSAHGEVLQTLDGAMRLTHGLGLDWPADRRTRVSRNCAHRMAVGMPSSAKPVDATAHVGWGQRVAKTASGDDHESAQASPETRKAMGELAARSSALAVNAQTWRLNSVEYPLTHTQWHRADRTDVPQIAQPRAPTGPTENWQWFIERALANVCAPSNTIEDAGGHCPEQGSPACASEGVGAAPLDTRAPLAYYATNRQGQVVYGFECVAPSQCLRWQRWSGHAAP